MARPRLDVGTTGAIALTPQAQDAQGKWGTAPEGVKPQRWQARCRVRDTDGQTRQVARFAATKGKAERAIRAALAEREAPAVGGALSGASTVADLGALWLAEHVSTLAAGSQRTYRGAYAAHVQDGPLWGLTVREVTVRAVASSLATVAEQSGPAAAASVRSVLRGMFNLAVAAGATDRNVVRDVPVPKAKAGKAKAKAAKGAGSRADVRQADRALTSGEREALRDVLAQSEDAAAPLLLFMLGTGCRVSEASALRWEDLALSEDHVGSTATICGTAVYVQGEGMRRQEHTKTDAGMRTVPLAPWLSQALAERAVSPQRVPGSAYVFPSAAGTLRDQSGTSAAVRRLLDDAGLPWATSHTLRRSAATALDAAGYSARQIGAMLGQRDVRTTLNLYVRPGQAGPDMAAVL